MFHEHDIMEENVRGTKLTFEGVADLTLDGLHQKVSLMMQDTRIRIRDKNQRTSHQGGRNGDDDGT